MAVWQEGRGIKDVEREFSTSVDKRVLEGISSFRPLDDHYRYLSGSPWYGLVVKVKQKRSSIYREVEVNHATLFQIEGKGQKTTEEEGFMPVWEPLYNLGPGSIYGPLSNGKIMNREELEIFKQIFRQHLNDFAIGAKLFRKRAEGQLLENLLQDLDCYGLNFSRKAVPPMPR